jgi:hypothetical protein
MGKIGLEEQGRLVRRVRAHSEEPVTHADLEAILASRGVVTLPTDEREGPATHEISSSRDRIAPRVHRRGAESVMRLGRSEVALDIEDVVDGGMG